MYPTTKFVGWLVGGDGDTNHNGYVVVVLSVKRNVYKIFQCRQNAYIPTTIWTTTTSEHLWDLVFMYVPTTNNVCV